MLTHHACVVLPYGKREKYRFLVYSLVSFSVYWIYKPARLIDRKCFDFATIISEKRVWRFIRLAWHFGCTNYEISIFHWRNMMRDFNFAFFHCTSFRVVAMRVMYFRRPIGCIFFLSHRVPDASFKFLEWWTGPIQSSSRNNTSCITKVELNEIHTPRYTCRTSWT